MNAIIERYKKIRKKGLLQKKYTGKYAFVGIGNHSLNNLYPVLNYLNVAIKYIVVKSEETKDLVQKNYPNIKVTINFDEVLADKEIKGIFVSANPTAHFNIAKLALASNKNVFLEKPPCSSLKELNELITAQNISGGQVLAGLQRRYSPVFNTLINKVKKATYYTIKYKTGGYPEGDELLDLFIHPLDALFYLFGEGAVENVKVIKEAGTITYLAQLQHVNGVVGNIEFSTAHSWAEAQDVLTVNTPKGEYITENTSKLIFKSKPKVIAGIPLEKVKPFFPQTITLYQQNNFLPVKEHNQLYSAGYYNELITFLQLCEGGSKNQSSLKMLIATFKAIEVLKTKKE